MGLRARPSDQSVAWPLEMLGAIRRRSLSSRLDRLAQCLRRHVPPPIIVIGMHRSGTSLVTRILRRGGAYFGHHLDPHSEAVIFMRFNHTFMTVADLKWFAPREGLDTRVLAEHRKILRYLLGHQRLLWDEFFSHFGEEGEESFRFASEEELLLPRPRWRDIAGTSVLGLTNGATLAPWGWKDPRTTWTLSVWLRLFPDARVLHVVRSGIDCALSLWRRCRQSGEGAPNCLEVAHCFHLWERYVTEGLRWRSLGSHYLELQYERVLEEPVTQIRRLLGFAQLPEHVAESLAPMVDPQTRRPTSYAEHPELGELSRRSALSYPFGAESGS